MLHGKWLAHPLPRHGEKSGYATASEAHALHFKVSITHCQGRPQVGGGVTGEFCSGPQPERGPRRPHEGPLEYLFEDRYTLIEQSDLNTLIEQSQYCSEEQCSKPIDREIWLVRGSYCHCQQVMNFFFFLVFSL